MYVVWYLQIVLVSTVCAAEVASWALQIEMVVHLGIGWAASRLRAVSTSAVARNQPKRAHLRFWDAVVFFTILDDKGHFWYLGVIGWNITNAHQRKETLVKVTDKKRKNVNFASCLSPLLCPCQSCDWGEYTKALTAHWGLLNASVGEVEED